MDTAGLDWAMEKTAAFGFVNAGKLLSKELKSSDITRVSKAMPSAMKLLAGVATAAGVSLFALSKAVGKVMADARKKRVLEELKKEDPIIKAASPGKVLAFYGTIQLMAPRLAADKNIVKELLQNFIKFDRVDLNSIKTLADTHKSMAGADVKIQDLMGRAI